MNIIYSAFALFALACFALSPQARASCQQGCDLTNGNTFLGDDALVNSTGFYNIAIGVNALASNVNGVANTATGAFALQANTNGSNNTAVGYYALVNNTSGQDNTAAGVYALYYNTIGFNNTAIGIDALLHNTAGNSNTAIGESALVNNGGDANTATGVDALYNNNGFNNTATGVAALLYNISGSNNTAVGEQAMLGELSGSSGSNNTATGVQSLYSYTTGSFNTADGYRALYNNTTGHDNTATGNGSLLQNTTGINNTAAGSDALGKNTTGSYNVALGFQAGIDLTTGGRNIDISNRGLAGESNTIRIGRVQDQTATFIAGISGATVANGVGVIIDTNGRLGTIVSSARFKDEIKPMDKTSEAILALQPMTFRYKKELDPHGIPQFGLVAEDVEKVDPDLVTRDEQGKPYTVRYEAVNAMLLNEFLKEHRTVQELKSTAAKQEATIAQQQKQIDALTAGLQKVSVKLEVSKAAPRTVLNNP